MYRLIRLHKCYVDLVSSNHFNSNTKTKSLLKPRKNSSNTRLKAAGEEKMPIFSI